MTGQGAQIYDLNVSTRAGRGRLLSESGFDAQPNRSEKTRGNDGDHRLKRITLRLLDASSPSPQVLEIGAQLASISLFKAERSQDSRDGLDHHGVDIASAHSILFNQCLNHDRFDIRLVHWITVV